MQERAYQKYQQNHQNKNNSPQKRTGNRGDYAENTKDNLMEEQSRSPNIVYTYKERDPKYYGHFNEVNRHQSNKKSIQ